MSERPVTHDGVTLCLETFGKQADPAVLLIAGASQSMDWWEAEFCQRLANQGRFVVRYDHRDTGRSETSPAGEPSYSGDDLSMDPLRILDTLGIARAHVVGVSMGGGITQLLAALHSDRLLTATLISTSPAGERADQTRLPSMKPRAAAAFEHPPATPDWDDREAVVNYVVETERPFAGSVFDEDRVRRIANVVLDRTQDIAATMTNHWMVAGEPGPDFRLADITVPTLVLHGTDDPAFPLGHGEALAAEIPDATLIPLTGMGHGMPPYPLWDLVVTAIARHTEARSRRKSI